MALVTNTITLTKRERMELMRRATSRTGRTEDTRRALVILLLAEGRTWEVVCEHLVCNRGFVATWRQRFADARPAGLYSRHRGQAPIRLTPQMEAHILDTTRRAPTDGSTPWSTRKLAVQPGGSHMRVTRVWAKHGLKPHRSRLRDEGN
jgi:transposase